MLRRITLFAHLHFSSDLDDIRYQCETKRSLNNILREGGGGGVLFVLTERSQGADPLYTDCLFNKPLTRLPGCQRFVLRGFRSRSMSLL